MDSLAKELSELGWIEIDYNKPLNESVSVGDLLITTEMYIFEGYGDSVVVHRPQFDNMNNDKFTVLNTDDRLVQMEFDVDDPDEGWFEPEGRIFIKKQKLEYLS